MLIRMYRPERTIHSATHATADRALCGRALAGFHNLDALTDPWSRIGAEVSTTGACRACERKADAR